MEAKVKGFTIVAILVLVSVIGGWIYEEQAWHPSDSETIRYGTYEYTGTISNDTHTEKMDAAITLTSSKMMITINGQTWSYDVPSTMKETWHLERTGDTWYDPNGRAHATTEQFDGTNTVIVTEDGYIVDMELSNSVVCAHYTLKGWHR